MKLWQKFKQAANKNDDPEDEIKKSFQQFDINGDGYITKDEITEVWKCLLKMIYCSRALKSHSKLRAAIGLRDALGIFLLHKNSSLFTVTFGEKVLTLAKSRGSYLRGYGI